ncbi:MAG: hypothetical protein WDN08_01410 [Rhizomicrobium sp.]
MIGRCRPGSNGAWPIIFWRRARASIASIARPAACWRRGRFFGVVCRGNEVFAFLNTAPDESADSENSGAIVAYARDGDGLANRRVLVEGLDHNCHQIDYFDGAFFVVDTLHQRILEYDARWRPVAAHQLLPPAARDGPGHAHINSIAGDADTVRVLLHNFQRGLASEIVEYDRAFRERGRTVLPCSACHDIALLEDGRLLTCLSPEGRIGIAGGETFPVDQHWTRGLVVGLDEIAVGSSLYGARIGRAFLPGFVTFLDRGFRHTGRVHVPAAPTQMRAF